MSSMNAKVIIKIQEIKFCKNKASIGITKDNIKGMYVLDFDRYAKLKSRSVRHKSQSTAMRNTMSQKTSLTMKKKYVF